MLTRRYRPIRVEPSQATNAPKVGAHATLLLCGDDWWGLVPRLNTQQPFVSLCVGSLAIWV